MRETGKRSACFEFSLACFTRNFGLDPNLKEQLNGPSEADSAGVVREFKY